MHIQLSDHFTYAKLLRFTTPSMAGVLFISVYSVIDGLFVSHFVGPTPFAAVNIVWPFIMIFGAIGFMLGSGGSALVAKTLGEGRAFKANQIFSLLIYSILTIGVLFALTGMIYARQMIMALGVDGVLLNECLIYAYILFPAIPALMLQVIFQSFMVTAERPKFGFAITITAGVINFILDILFIVYWHWGLSGAAWATAISQFIGGGVPLIYFILPNKSLLHLGRTKLYLSALGKSCSNGLSEFISNVSMSVVGMLYNYQMLRLIGESGVIAYGIISYVNFIFLSLFLGYGVGSNPIVSYHFGAQNHSELHNLFSKSLKLVACTGILLVIIAEISAERLARVFIGYDPDLVKLTAHGFQIYALSFALAGFNIYASAFFTALNNGIVSAIIASARTFVFECLCVLFLPILFGLNGIWFAIIVAETLALGVSCYFWIHLKPRYQY